MAKDKLESLKNKSSIKTIFDDLGSYRNLGIYTNKQLLVVLIFYNFLNKLLTRTGLKDGIFYIFV